MAEYPFPNWIRPPDIADEYARGLQIGQQAASEQQRLQMQQEESQRQHLFEQQKLNVQKAYQDQQLAMQKQELEQATKLNALKTQDAAARLAAQQQYQQWVNSGGDPTEGLMRFGPQMGETMSGYAGLAKDITQQRHPFVPHEIQVGDQRLMQTSQNAYHIIPPVLSSGPVQGQPVLDPVSKKPISGMVALPGPRGMEYRNLPKASTARIEKEMQAISDRWPRFDIEGKEEPTGPTSKQAFEKDQKRYRALKKELEGGAVDQQDAIPSGTKRFRFNPQTGDIEPIAASAPDTDEEE